MSRNPQAYRSVVTRSRRFSKRPSLGRLGQYLLVWGIPVRGDIATASDAINTVCGLPGGAESTPWHAPERGQVRPMELRHDDRQTTETSGSAALDTDPAAPSAGSRPEPWVLARHALGWWPLVAVLWFRRVFRSGWSALTRHSRMRPHICGPGIWSGRTGCTARRCRSSRLTSPVRPCSTRRSARWRTASGVYRCQGSVPDVHARGNHVSVGAPNQLYGNRAAFFAAALFAVAGPTLHLGAFATYDAMSVFLIALACLVRGSAQGRAGWNRLDGSGGIAHGGGKRRGLFVASLRPHRAS